LGLLAVGRASQISGLSLMTGPCLPARTCSWVNCSNKLVDTGETEFLHHSGGKGVGCKFSLLGV
jgi:hypothetical protein